MLKKKSLTAGEIAENFSMSKPSISHHLSILLSAGLVTVEKEGQNRIYSVNMTVAQELIELVAKMTEKKTKGVRIKMEENNIDEDIFDDKSANSNKGFPVWLRILITAFTVLETIVVLLAILKMPETIPVHFNYNFEIDRYGSPFYLLIIGVILFMVCILSFFFPLKKNKDTKKSILASHFIITGIVIWISVILWGLVALAFQAESIQGSLAKKFFPVIFSIPFGIFAIFYGNYAAIIPRNFTLGIKTAYALSSNDAWRHVQRVGGFSFVIAGIVLTISGIISLSIPNSLINIASIVVFLAIAVGVPSVYSFVKRCNK